MKIHQMSGEHSESAGLSAAFGGTRDRRDVTHEHSREIKTTSEVITGNCATVITSEVVLPCAVFVCDVPPIARAAKGGTQPRAFMDLHGPSW